MSRVKKKKKHTTLKVMLVLAVLAGGGTAGYIYYMNQAISETIVRSAYKEEKVSFGNVAVGITESGTVTLGSLEQTFTIPEVISVSSDSSSGSGSSSGGSSQSGMNNSGTISVNGGSGGSSSGSMGSSSSSGSSTSLEVEEIYVKVGQVVAEGDAVLKLTDESIADYRAELEAAVESARLLVRQEEINVESKQAEADYTYQMYLALGETAEETYQATLTSLDNEVEDLQEELEDALEELEELQAEYDAGYDVEEELEEAELACSTIEANLQIAINNRTTQSIEAKRTYEEAVTNYNYADELYEIDTDGLEDDLNDARETLEEAETAFSEFDENIGDGVIYAEYSGTVLSISYSEGDTLTSDAAVAAYSNAEDVTITVSVSQEDISQISTGGSAAIVLTAYEGESFDGEVTEIETSSSIGSSTVNYDVKVSFIGDTSKIYSGMTGEVTFVEQQTVDTIYVSNKAIYQDGSRSYVKVLQDDGTIEEVTVKTGFSNGSIVAVEEGLEEGQTVIIESQVAA